MTRDSIDILAALAALTLAPHIPGQGIEPRVRAYVAEDITRVMRDDRDYYMEVDDTFDMLERLEADQLVNSSGSNMRGARWSITVDGLYKVLCR